VSERSEPVDKHDVDKSNVDKGDRDMRETGQPDAAKDAGPRDADVSPAEPVSGESERAAADDVAGENAPDKSTKPSDEHSAAVSESTEDGASADTPDAAMPAARESRRYVCANPGERAAGLIDAASVIRRGELIVLPTDTVYGIGADAFTPSAVTALLDAKGRGRDMPVPVLVGTVRAANALVEDLGTYGQDLVDAFWPGPLTLILRVNRSLFWDLGETKGTVAIRMPLHQLALELLKETGPMAVSSANRSGASPATTAVEAEEQLGNAVSVYLDGGPCTENVPSTILDLTTPVPRVLRKGAVPVDKLRAVVGYVATDD
jgi:tRNA threonylcarbamoyl adenosine modification protein (Sua5/YciO/YrdC/YwlC family)